MSRGAWVERPGRPTSHDDRGGAVVELAVALPGLVVVVAALAWVLSLVGAQVRCTDAAGEAARAIGRGETTAVAAAVARHVAPKGASITVNPAGTAGAVLAAGGQGGGELVSVEVRAQLRPPALGPLTLPGVTVSSTTVALTPAGGDGR
ncbi:MAG: TadE family type IV pilus minor pilin [Actinomycetales bacterium]